MSAWRRKALELLPGQRRVIDSAPEPMALWIELHFALERAYHAPVPDDSLIRAIYEYARWCLDTPDKSDDPSGFFTAVIVAFFEHLPTDKRVREDLHRWLTKEEFLGLEAPFRYFLEEGEFERIKTDFLEKRERFLKIVPAKKR